MGAYGHGWNVNADDTIRPFLASYRQNSGDRMRAPEFETKLSEGATLKAPDNAEDVDWQLLAADQLLSG